MTRRLLPSALAAIALVATWPTVPAAQQPDDLQALQRRIAVLEASQQQMLKELQEIKALLLARPSMPAPPNPAVAPNAPAPLLPPAPGPVPIGDAASRGAATAKLTIVEFSDFQCPFCGRYSRETYAQIQSAYVEPGTVRYVFRNLPFENLHPQAFGAAVAGECARAQGKFWEMHDRMFANQRALTQPALVKTAEALGLDTNAFQACLASDAPKKKVRQDMADAAALGANATPMFYIGTVQKDGRLRTLRFIRGAKPFDAFKSVIDGILASPGLKD
jgi:protein-disulfide isomerase